MANIEITEITPSGSDLFSDSESYLTDLSEADINNIQGGLSPTFWLTGFTVATFITATVRPKPKPSENQGVPV